MTISIAITIFMSGLVIGAIGGFCLAVVIGNKIRRDEERRMEDLVSSAIQEVDDERQAR